MSPLGCMFSQIPEKYLIVSPSLNYYEFINIVFQNSCKCRVLRSFFVKNSFFNKFADLKLPTY